MTEEKTYSAKALSDMLSGYPKEKVLQRIAIPESALEEAVQSVYDECASHWIGGTIAEIYKATKIKPRYSEKTLKRIDEQMAKATSWTTGWGLGHEDAGSYIKYREVSDIIPIESLPQYAQTVQECYTKSYKSHWTLDLTQLFIDSGVKLDTDALAKKIGKPVQDIVDDIYEMFRKEGKKISHAKEMTGMDPSEALKERIGRRLYEQTLGGEQEGTG